MGPSLNNLNNLIQQPYGCGEQNMIGLTPNIYALDYINVIKNTYSSLSNLKLLEEKAKKNIIDGYQRQLTYQRSDGSFSAFGERDSSGSTFLTAFVVRSFALAKKYAPSNIDDAVINNAVAYLLKTQVANGSFVENGTVIHSELQGGVNSLVTITAYVTHVLIDIKSSNSNISKSIQSALMFLENENLNVTDHFGLGLITKVLLLNESRMSEKYFEIFDALAKTTEEYMYWPRKPNQVSDDDVEITSYGLLIYMAKNLSDNAVPIVKYLVSKMSQTGGFSSTQSTILALEALTKYSSLVLFGSDNQGWNLNISIRLENQNTSLKTFSVTSNWQKIKIYLFLIIKLFWV